MPTHRQHARCVLLMVNTGDTKRDRRIERRHRAALDGRGQETLDKQAFGFLVQRTGNQPVRRRRLAEYVDFGSDVFSVAAVTIQMVGGEVGDERDARSPIDTRQVFKLGVGYLKHDKIARGDAAKLR